MPNTPKPTFPQRMSARPRAYDHTRTPTQAYKLCLLGLHSTKALADFFQVTTETIGQWKEIFPAFREAVLDGTMGGTADAEVAHQLLKCALGYEVKAEQIVFDTKSGEFRRTEYMRHYPADVSAIKEWLHNRAKLHWRTRQQLEITGADGAALAVPIIIIEPVKTLEHDPQE